MLKVFVVYTHLIATCMALGLIISSDLRLLTKLLGYRCMIRPPKEFERRIILVALIALLGSGAALVALGLNADPHYLDNEKLLAKLALVTVLCLNAVFLHRVTFPQLGRRRPVSQWRLGDHLRVALPVALSNSLWFYCAFLGIARPWNRGVSFFEVLVPGLVAFAVLALLVLAALRLAAREAPATPPDWIDSMKARLSDHAPLDALAPGPHTSK